VGLRSAYAQTAPHLEVLAPERGALVAHMAQMRIDRAAHALPIGGKYARRGVQPPFAPMPTISRCRG
jgi:hypothetical protein